MTAGSVPQYEAVQAYLRRVGIDMRIKVIETGSIAAIARSRDYPVNTIGYPNFDPDSRHPAIWSVTAGFNPFGYEDSRLERLAAEAIRSLDEDLRARNYEEYFNVVVKEVLTLVYLQIDDLVIYDADKLTGVRVGRYIDPILREIRIRPRGPAFAGVTGVRRPLDPAQDRVPRAAAMNAHHARCDEAKANIDRLFEPEGPAATAAC